MRCGIPAAHGPAAHGRTLTQDGKDPGPATLRVKLPFDAQRDGTKVRPLNPWRMHAHAMTLLMWSMPRRTTRMRGGRVGSRQPVCRPPRPVAPPWLPMQATTGNNDAYQHFAAMSTTKSGSRRLVCRCTVAGATPHHSAPRRSGSCWAPTPTIRPNLLPGASLLRRTQHRLQPPVLRLLTSPRPRYPRGTPPRSRPRRPSWRPRPPRRHCPSCCRWGCAPTAALAGRTAARNLHDQVNGRGATEYRLAYATFARSGIRRAVDSPQTGGANSEACNCATRLAPCRTQVRARTFDFTGIRLGLAHEERRRLAVERVRGVGVQQQLGQEHLEHVDQVCGCGKGTQGVRRHQCRYAGSRPGRRATLQGTGTHRQRAREATTTTKTATNDRQARAAGTIPSRCKAHPSTSISVASSRFSLLTKHGAPGLVDHV